MRQPQWIFSLTLGRPRATLTVAGSLLFTVYLARPDFHSVNELSIAWLFAVGMIVGNLLDNGERPDLQSLSESGAAGFTPSIESRHI